MRKLHLVGITILFLPLGCSGGDGGETNLDTAGTGDGDLATGGGSDTGAGAGDPGGGASSGGSGAGDPGITGGGGTGGDAGGGGSGGDTTSGGGTSSGGTVATTCTEAEGEVCNSYQTGSHCGLTFEIWTDSASACMTNTTTGFLAGWDESDGNYLARKGVRPGSADPIVTYSADYNPNGNSYLGVYGWTTDPLIEYYIIDSWGSWRPPGTDVIGTVTTDGGTYEIYRSERVNQPSILGNTTFWQYWSVRTDKRTSGTITVRPHFEAWAEFGLTLGDFHEVSMLVEGYHSSGTANVTVAFQ